MPISIPRKGIRISCSGGPYCDGIRAPSLAVHIVLADGSVVCGSPAVARGKPMRFVTKLSLCTACRRKLTQAGAIT
jgi:hypothetical protein